jgi:hypothetical protein
MAKQGTIGEDEAIGISKVVRMCTSRSCHNMLSFLVTTATTNNTIATIDEVLLELLVLLLLTSWDIAHLIALTTLFDII